jgi:hypothetical protein
MSQIFLSYRRGDAPGYAGRLYDRLREHFGTDHVFRDVDTLPPGADFVAAIEDAVASCEALVAVIGGAWLSATDRHGTRRLDDPNDFVRIEVAAALARGVPVFPVLVESAQMPTESELPAPLARLARHNALELADSRWDYDVGRLLASMDRFIGDRGAAAAKAAKGASPRASADAPGGPAERTPTDDETDAAPWPGADHPVAPVAARPTATPAASGRSRKTTVVVAGVVLALVVGLLAFAVARSGRDTTASGRGAAKSAQPPADRQAVTSYDGLATDPPYYGSFGFAFQEFTAASNTITHVGVRVRSQEYPAGTPTPVTLNVRLCPDPQCTAVLAEANPTIVNDRTTSADFGDVPVTPGRTYYVYWKNPDGQDDTSWDTYWTIGSGAPGRRDITTADGLAMVVRGYNR